jgi:hypothetical protein
MERPLNEWGDNSRGGAAQVRGGMEIIAISATGRPRSSTVILHSLQDQPVNRWDPSGTCVEGHRCASGALWGARSKAWYCCDVQGASPEGYRICDLINTQGVDQTFSEWAAYTSPVASARPERSAWHRSVCPGRVPGSGPSSHHLGVGLYELASSNHGGWGKGYCTWCRHSWWKSLPLWTGRFPALL